MIVNTNTSIKVDFLPNIIKYKSEILLSTLLSNIKEDYGSKDISIREIIPIDNIFNYSGYYYYISKWDGNKLSELDSSKQLKANKQINAVYSDSNNNIYVGGSFTNDSGYEYVAKWDGNKWSELGGVNSLKANNQIYDIYVDKSNNVYTSGNFTNSSGNKYVAKWDGNKWKDIGGGAAIPMNKSGTLKGLCTDNNGVDYVGGDITNGTLRGIVAKLGILTDNTNIITGKITTPNNNSVKGYDINYWGASLGSIQGDINGNYSLNFNNCNYITHPTKNNDINKTNGVTAIDIALTQAHILGKNILNSPYKLIAADVNGDGKVTALDIVYMKRLILGLDTTFTKTSTKENRLWVFVDSSYKFADSTNPFPFKDSISYSNLNANQVNQTFIGIKLGDVNWDWNPALARMHVGVFVKPK